MQIIISDIKKIYTLTFSDTCISNNNTDTFDYMFIIKSPISNYIHTHGKYIYNININDFKEFIVSCLEFPIIKTSKFDFEINIILLITKYYNMDKISRSIILSMIGSMLIFNIKYKKFIYLKKLEPFIHSDDMIKYLIIIANNIKNLKQEKIIPEKDFLYNEINILDFIFDYYE